MTHAEIVVIKSTMLVAVSRICRYPVKGLSVEDLDRVNLAPGEGLPHDRRFALAHGNTKFDPLSPEWQPKSNFLMLMRNEQLARLETRFEDADGTLTISRNGKRVTRGKITTPVGRAVIEDFFAAYMRADLRGKPRLVEAPGHMFSDSRDKVVSIVNLASVHDVERVVGRPVDPIRFRANIYLEGLDPWAEFDWVGQSIMIGDAQLDATSRIVRCAATEVDPQTGARDMNVVQALRRGFGHADMGLYAAVKRAGSVTVGDEVVASPLTAIG